jgi:hypothetical protein
MVASNGVRAGGLSKSRPPCSFIRSINVVSTIAELNANGYEKLARAVSVSAVVAVPQDRRSPSATIHAVINEIAAPHRVSIRQEIVRTLLAKLRRKLLGSGESPMPSRRKLDWEKINAALNILFPHCSASIPPDQQTRVDFDHMKCPQCGKTFIPNPSSKQRNFWRENYR